MRLELPASLPPVVGNQAQLTQAIINLVMNAFEAIGDNDGYRPEIEIGARQDESGRVHVTVRDSGRAIGPEIMPRLFEPLFTTNHRAWDWVWRSCAR